MVTLKSLKDQVMVITGGSSGIGLVTARAAARGGASVFLVARSGDALRTIAEGIVADGGIADFAVADVGDLEQVRQAAAKAVARFGRIDTWVNNAGVAIYAKLTQTPPAEHEQLFRTNYFGAVNGSLVALEHLRDRGGALITVASIAADIPSPIMGAYAASKHAVKAYIESLRIECTADALPVSITLIKPAGIDTPIGKHAFNRLEGEAMIPPPVYDPRLVADAILDAAQVPRRDVTVGGMGRLQVLITTHFPWIVDLFGGALIPALHDPERPKTATNNLMQPANAGRERSGEQRGMQHSLYTSARRHPALVLGAATLAGVSTLALLAGRRLPGRRLG